MKTKALPLLLLAFAGVAGATSVRAEKNPYDIEDVKACSADAMRLCKDKLPDLDAIQTCMTANYDRLKPACKARFHHN